MLMQPWTLEALVKDRTAERLRAVERERLANQARRHGPAEHVGVQPAATPTPAWSRRGLPFWDMQSSKQEAS